jgi:hypothetical protein
MRTEFWPRNLTSYRTRRYRRKNILKIDLKKKVFRAVDLICLDLNVSE